MVSARNIKIDGDVNSVSARSCFTDAAMGKKNTMAATKSKLKLACVFFVRKVPGIHR